MSNTQCLSFFFFQAEDGIRDYKVTGVQTCALPICDLAGRGEGADADGDGSELADREGRDEPLRTVGEEDGDAVALPDADGEERARQLIGPGPERAVREPLIADDHGVCVGARPRRLVQQVAECPAARRHTGLDYSRLSGVGNAVTRSAFRLRSSRAEEDTPRAPPSREGGQVPGRSLKRHEEAQSQEATSAPSPANASIHCTDGRGALGSASPAAKPSTPPTRSPKRWARMSASGLVPRRASRARHAARTTHGFRAARPPRPRATTRVVARIPMAPKIAVEAPTEA